MAKFKIAHIKEQGQQMVLVPLDSSFGHKSDADQQATIAALQACVRGAKLAGTVVVAWRSGNTFKFIAPRPWHPFFKSISYMQIIASCNKELTCGD
jgi:hypothetical protein